jgi:ethanolamine utilization protein EutP (predicted NTPase)
MTKTIREILDTKTGVINIDGHWPTLRQKQYYTAMCELKQELEVLESLPNIADSLKTKVSRSLEKITGLINKLSKKLN